MLRMLRAREVERVLLAAVGKHPNIEILEDHIGGNLNTARNIKHAGPDRCCDREPKAEDTGRVLALASPVIVLATGGSGQLYLHTTNPDIATGNGVAWHGGRPPLLQTW